MKCKIKKASKGKKKKERERKLHFQGPAAQGLPKNKAGTGQQRVVGM